MQHKPAPIDGQLHAGSVLGRAATVLNQKRLVDVFEVNAALHRLNQIGDLEDPSRGLFRIGVGAGGGVFRAPALSSLSAPRATILIDALRIVLLDPGLAASSVANTFRSSP